MTASMDQLLCAMTNGCPVYRRGPDWYVDLFHSPYRVPDGTVEELLEQRWVTEFGDHVLLTITGEQVIRRAHAQRRLQA